jgi:hypothetical protein
LLSESKGKKRNSSKLLKGENVEGERQRLVTGPPFSPLPLLSLVFFQIKGIQKQGGSPVESKSQTRTKVCVKQSVGVTLSAHTPSARILGFTEQERDFLEKKRKIAQHLKKSRREQSLYWFPLLSDAAWLAMYKTFCSLRRT